MIRPISESQPSGSVIINAALLHKLITISMLGLTIIQII